eukprot:13230686-Alexandrium_andersonii.AAC.1
MPGQQSEPIEQSAPKSTLAKPSPPSILKRPASSEVPRPSKKTPITDEQRSELLANRVACGMGPEDFHALGVADQFEVESYSQTEEDEDKVEGQEVEEEEEEEEMEQ